jgi:hypothetical protein
LNEVSPVDDEARMTMRPLRPQESTHAEPASRSGEYPVRDACTSFSEAARVARPMRVNRK